MTDFAGIYRAGREGAAGGTQSPPLPTGTSALGEEWQPCD